MSCGLFITGTGTYKEAKFEEDAQKIVDYYHEEGYARARVGNVYSHESGGRVTVTEVMGESPNCPGARPLAVAFE